jgi:hypothetical protein
MTTGIYNLINQMLKNFFGIRPTGGGGGATPEQVRYDNIMQLTTLVLTWLIMFWVFRGCFFMIGWIFKRISSRNGRYD